MDEEPKKQKVILNPPADDNGKPIFVLDFNIAEEINTVKKILNSKKFKSKILNALLWIFNLQIYNYYENGFKIYLKKIALVTSDRKIYLWENCRDPQTVRISKNFKVEVL